MYLVTARVTCFQSDLQPDDAASTCWQSLKATTKIWQGVATFVIISRAIVAGRGVGGEWNRRWQNQKKKDSLHVITCIIICT